MRTRRAALPSIRITPSAQRPRPSGTGANSWHATPAAEPARQSRPAGPLRSRSPQVGAAEPTPRAAVVPAWLPWSPRLAPPRIGENVNNPQSRGIDLDGEPGGRLGLGLRKRQSVGKKRGELVFLAGLASSVTSSPTVTIAISPQFRRASACRVDGTQSRAGLAGGEASPRCFTRPYWRPRRPGVLRLAGPQMMTSWAAAPQRRAPA
jgi:hypothetical protein